MPPKSAKQNSPAKNKQDVATYKCTACPKVIKTTLDAKLHPLIGALVCRKCYATYGNGDFSSAWPDGVDEFGDDNYCRWCCDGGDLFGCMNEEESGERCHYSFCKDCIQNNVPEDEILTLDDLDEEEKQKLKWLCYSCDKNKIAKLRKDAKEALKDLIKRAERRSAEPSAASKKCEDDSRAASVAIFPISRRRETTDHGSKTGSTTIVRSSEPKKRKLEENGAKESESLPKAMLAPENPSNDISLILDGHRKTKDTCVEAVGVKFDNPVEVKNSARKSVEPKQRKLEENGAKEPASLPKSIPVPENLSNDPSLRLDGPRKTKDTCVEAVGVKFDNLVEMRNLGRKSVEPTATSKKCEDDSRAALVAITPTSKRRETTDHGSKAESTTIIRNSEPKQRKLEENGAKEPASLPKSIPVPENISNDLPLRSDGHRKTKDTCVEAVGVKFDNPVEIRNSGRKSVEPTATSKKCEDDSRAALVAITPTSKRRETTDHGSKTESTTIIRNSEPKKRKLEQNGVKESTSLPKAIIAPENRSSSISLRLDVYRKTKDICVEEIGVKFDNLVEMMNSKGLSKQIIDIEIDSLLKPILEFQNMLSDLRAQL